LRSRGDWTQFFSPPAPSAGGWRRKSRRSLLF
jgi:hypothetical protein